MMKIESQSMAVAPQWGEIYSKGAIYIFTCKYGHLWQLFGMTYQTTIIINDEILHGYDEN